MSEFWHYEAQFDIGEITRGTQEAFRAQPGVVIAQDPSKVTWYNLNVLTTTLREVTDKVKSEAWKLDQERGRAGEWRTEDRTRFWAEMVSWDERLSAYQAMIDPHLQTDPDEFESAWRFVGERLLYGVFRYTEGGEERVLDTIPDFVTPYMLANQLAVTRQWMDDLRDRWVDMLLHDLKDASREAVESAAEIVGTAVGAAAGAAAAIGRHSGTIAIGVAAIAAFVLLRKK